MEKKKPRKKYYIQPEDLRVEILDYKTTGEASERLGEMLIQIAYGLAAGSKWDRRTYRDDMAGDAVVRMYKNLYLIDTTDPSDLTSLCHRDYKKDAVIKYSVMYDAENPEEKVTDWADCVITKHDLGSETCNIKMFTEREEYVDAEDPNDPDAKIKEIVRHYKPEIKNIDLTQFQFKKTNPFSYLTMIAHRVYLSRSIKENKNDNGLNEYREECYSEFESAECISNRSPSEGDMDMGFDPEQVGSD